MKIGVCVKGVPEPSAARIDPDTMRLDRSGPLVINAFDLNAVEEALRIKESTAEGEVVAVSFGPEPAWEALQKALSMGADRALFVTDDRAVGSDLLATGYALAKVIENEAFDLVFFGQQSSDADGAVLSAAVADRLRLPAVSQVSALTVDGATVTARRQTEFGYERIELQLPAIVSVSDAINEPRYPSLRGIMAAKKKPIKEISLESIGIDAERVGQPGSRTWVDRLLEAPRRQEGVVIEDDGTAAERIVEFLVQQGILT
jgi:electron transfer flavoprotein beta subunit